MADRRMDPITVDRIVDTAFTLVQAEGFDALTMRRVAAALDTGPASLYAHVRNKAELDGLLIGALASRILLPTPSRARWRAQILDVCRQLRDLYLAYPGVSRAALAADPNSLDSLALSEGMLGILLTGGIEPRAAAWAIDAAFLYVSAYSFEVSLRRRPVDAARDDVGRGGLRAVEVDDRILDRPEITARLRALPVDRFPHTVANAETLTSGEEHERFDFTLELLFRGLAPSA